MSQRPLIRHRIHWRWGFLLLGLWLLSHLPFLGADADADLSFSRAPWTDEGLYSGQVRNFFYTGTLRLEEGDALIKSPGYSLLLSFPLALGAHHFTLLRFFFLGCIASIWCWLWWKRPVLRLFLIGVMGIGMLEYSIHQFSHLALAEAMASFLLVGALFWLRPNGSGRWSHSQIRVACLLVFGAILLKFQYVYLLPLLPLAMGLYHRSWRAFFHPLLWLTGLSGLLFLLWYWPNRELFHYLMDQQSGHFRWSEVKWGTIEFNWNRFPIHTRSWLFEKLYLFCVPFGLWAWRKGGPTFRWLLLATLLWNLLESHKLAMTYLPTRYLISSKLSMALLMAVVATEWIRRIPQWYARALVLLPLVVLLVHHAQAWQHSYAHRQWGMRDLDTYVAQHYKGVGPLLGVWANSANWSTPARAIPIWHHFLNDKASLTQWQPEVVVVEKGEGCVNEAFRQQGIDLSTEADSVRVFPIHTWEVQVFWMR